MTLPRRVFLVILLVPALCFADPRSSNQATVVLHNLTMWQDQSGGVLRSVKKLVIGEEVTVLNKSARFKQDGKDLDFTRVRCSDGQEGWVRTQYVAPNSTLAVVTADRAVVFSEPRDTKATPAWISVMTIVAVFPKESTGGFAKVRCFDAAQNMLYTDSTYVETKDLSTSAIDLGAVIAYSIAAATSDLAARRDLLATIVRKYAGSPFSQRALAALGGIAKPTIAASGLYRATIDKVNVRVSPDELNGLVVGQINKGDFVKVLEKTMESYTIKGQTAPWYRIIDPSGWVFGAFLTFSP